MCENLRKITQAYFKYWEQGVLYNKDIDSTKLFGH